MGKTSIIITVVSETFPRGSVAKTYHPVILSSDLYMLPASTQTVLIDSSPAKEDEQETDAEIEKAQVIVLVYAVYNVEGIKRLKSYWLPRIQRHSQTVEIIFFLLILVNRSR